MKFGLSFILLFIFWVLLSGHFDWFHLSLGILCSLLVAFFSHGILFEEVKPRNIVRRTVRFVLFLPWLFYEIILSNLDVVYRTLHPRMPIDPTIVRFRTDLEEDLTVVTLANSITLTPGTVTLDIEDGEYIVHTLTRESARSLLRGEFQKRIKAIET